MVRLASQDALDTASESKMSRYHLRIVLTAGMGFFTDAYDLFIIGVITAMLSPIWHLTTGQLALLNGSALLSAAFGAIFFGILSDRFGRKKMYGIEVLILFVGALLSACSPSFSWLLFSRILVGFGIGGDYPSSAVVASEHSNSKNRGFLVLLVFAMQAVGLIMGTMLACLLLALHVPTDLAWRLLLGFGAIPAASVFYLRRTIEETPHFLLSKKKSVLEVSRVISDLTGHTQDVFKKVVVTKHNLFSGKWLIYLIGTAGAWFLLDVAFYGNGVSSVLIMQAINAKQTLLVHTFLSGLLFLCFAVPGYILAAKYVDVIGRKRLQMLGFLVMTLCFAMIALVPGVITQLPIFLGLFGLSFFFVNFGPNTTTFLIPSEIYPTSIRAKAHGLSAAVGKLGAFVGVFFLPSVLKAQGLPFTIGTMAVVSLLGAAITLLVPEMKNKGLELTESIR